MKERIEKVLKYASRSVEAQDECALFWIIDQMVMALTGCPEENGEQFGNEEYYKVINEARKGESGPNTHWWHSGMKPFK